MDLRYARPRKDLILLLREKGIQDNRVLEAMGRMKASSLPDSALHNHAYEDKAFPIGDGQTISLTSCFSNGKVEIKKKKVWDWDRFRVSGSGLNELGAFSLYYRTFRTLYDKTSHLLQRWSIQRFTYYGDGFGKPIYAPFDKCIVTAAAPHVPDLIDQLRSGMLIIPVDNSRVADMLRITKLEDGVKEEVFDTFSLFLC